MYFSCSFLFLSSPPLYCPHPAQIDVESIAEVTECPCYVVHTECSPFTAMKGSGLIHPQVVKMLVLCYLLLALPLLAVG